MPGSAFAHSRPGQIAVAWVQNLQKYTACGPGYVSWYVTALTKDQCLQYHVFALMSQKIPAPAMQKSARTGRKKGARGPLLNFVGFVRYQAVKFKRHLTRSDESLNALARPFSLRTVRKDSVPGCRRTMIRNAAHSHQSNPDWWSDRSGSWFRTSYTGKQKIRLFHHPRYHQYPEQALRQVRTGWVLRYRKTLRYNAVRSRHPSTDR